MRKMTFIASALLMLGLSGGAAFAQDAAAGEQVFKKCRSCHQVGPEAKNGVGPAQNGVIGRRAGTVEGYNYSAINKAAGEAGLVWTEENVFAYLADPNAFLKAFLTEKGKADLATGSTKMAFKLADEGERKSVVAYLKTVPAK
ncbi:MAG: c-type cytochrome [Hyphomicrobiaceae bacterium]